MELLKTLSASSPVFPNDQSQVFYVNKCDKINVGFQKLIDNNILTLPVYDETKKKFTTFLSMSDIVFQILELTHNEDVPRDGEVGEILNTLQERNLFKKEYVGDVADLSKREPFITVGFNQTLDEVARLMVNNDISRVAVLDKNGQLCNIVTTSRILECISNLFGMDNELTLLGNKMIGDMGIINPNVLTIKSTDKAMCAFEIIGKMGVSGVGVVDANDPKRLVGVISNSDLRLIKSHAQYLNLLYLPVKEYLNGLNKFSTTPKQVITCKKTHLFKNVVEMVSTHRIHRIFVVDDDEKLIGIISLNAILEQIVRSSKNTKASPISK